MPKTVEAIYENGVFKPIKKVRLGEHEKVELTILRKAEMDDATKKALSIIGIGGSSFKDTALRHDEYLYGKRRQLLKKIKR
ncbi:MAG: antitoxin family protein [Nitrospirota bacterium]